MDDDYNEVHGLSTAVFNEDSVDIYSGLDTSPTHVAEKSGSFLSPRLKESMDLYEELVTEERLDKDSSYNELKDRFQAAQSQIEELCRRLQQMEAQNTGLNVENCRLKKNISVLLRTARMEVMRKDEMIQRLNKSQGGDRPYYQPHINGLRDSVSTRRSCPGGPTSKPPPPPTEPPPPPSSPPPLPPPPPPPTTPPPPSREDDVSSLEEKVSGRLSHVRSRCSSRGDPEVTSKHLHITPSVTKSGYSSSSGHGELDKRRQSKHKEEKCDSRRGSESTDQKQKYGSDSRKEWHVNEKNRSHRAEKERGKYDYKSSKSKYCSGADGHGRTERARSPLSDRSKVLSEDTSEMQSKGRIRELRQDRGTFTDPVHRMASSSSGSKESSKVISEIQSKGCRRESRKDNAGDERCRSNSDSKDRKQTCSDPHNLSERSSESSRRKGGTSPSRRDHRRKEERRWEDEIRRGDKRRTQSERSRESEKKSSKEHDEEKADLSSKDGEKKTEGTKGPLEEPNVAGKNSVEENSPKRKLCFMETLNLTLSPVKKPGLPIDTSKREDALPDKVLDSGTEDGGEQPDVADMCVIDEIDSSLCGMEIDEVPNDQEAQPPLDVTTPPNPEMIDRTCDYEEVNKEHDKILNERTVVNEQPEDNNVQTSSECSHKLSEATEDQRTEPPTQKLPNMSCAVAPESDIISKAAMPSKGCASDSKTVGSGELVGTARRLSGNHGNKSERDTGNSAERISHENQIVEATDFNDPTVLDSSVQTPEPAVTKSQLVEMVTGEPVDSGSKEDLLHQDVTGKAKPESQHISPSVLPQGSQQQLSSAASSNSNVEKDACTVQDVCKDADDVSSTIGMEVFPQEGLSLPEAIYVLTQMDEDVDGIDTEPSSSTGCIGVSKVSSTTEEMAPPEQHVSSFACTPEKSYSTVKGYTENGEDNVEPSSSMPLPPDEDSMMHTLNNLKHIPDVISPLRSPVQLNRRSLHSLHVHAKPAHVKSLRKDFSSTAVDVNSMKLEVNKENKYPGSPLKHDAQKNADTSSNLPSSLSDSELEEGEILSETEEGTAASPIQSPNGAIAKSTRRVKNQPSPKSASRSSKRISEGRYFTSKEMSETASTGSPSSNKSRFKMVCPTASNTSFSTKEEVMETFKTLRHQIRRKYMKLHKTFPKKSFYGMMDSFQYSFLEFVDGACFIKICSQVGDLKARLRNMITSVFTKVSNNGIVKRIFEQKADDLKQKLWEFVNVQLDYLFKEIQDALTGFCKPTNGNHPARTEDREKKHSGDEKIHRKSPVSTFSKQQPPHSEVESVPINKKRIRPQTISPHRTGLGSRGKDIRMIREKDDGGAEPHRPGHTVTQTLADFLLPKNIPSTPQKSGHITPSLVRHLSSSTSQDKADFEILTEQQASSLTFNLVRDSQMGEIFKCLLQGSDLLDGNVSVGDNSSWSISTPRKEALPGERLISIGTPTTFSSPTKFESPSKLIATWSSISPRKMSSPPSKVDVPLNPALFDESCLLEVPSESRMTPQSNLFSQRSYSILAEDLAVSLTIPSPLKSDSHLSFLHPASREPMCTPDSVISAHFSEDALLDGEDASEQDIHLALDTDNSSCGSSIGEMEEAASSPPFHFKPHLPMQAVVMEKSNDHFIVKIRQASTSADVTLTADESLSRTLTEDDLYCREKYLSAQETPSNAVLSVEPSQKMKSPSKIPSENSQPTLSGSPEAERSSQVLPPHLWDSSTDEMETPTMSERSLIVDEVSSTPEGDQKDCKMGKKRKKHQKKSKRKRPKKEEEKKKSKKEVSKSPKDKGTRSSKKETSKVKSPSVPLSPNSLSAKNVVRKKGEVVIAWTRDEDRAILLELKMKGASRETFTALSEKLNKPSAQIAERFAQLMKLFKKREKMES